MMTRHSHAVLIGIITLAAVTVAHAQHAFERTKTVDLKTVGDPPEPVADFDDIQTAINACTQDGGKWTVLIYSGLYELTDPLMLDEDDENIDLVGIDRDAVIISVTGTDKHGIVITSGTETSRNNRIANLTIKTSNGHGIEIVKGGTPVPRNIVIEGVTILADGTGNHGVEGSVADTVRIFDCKITSQKGLGINRGKNFDIVHTVLSPAETKRGGAIRSGKKGAGSSQSDITGR